MRPKDRIPLFDPVGGAIKRAQTTRARAPHDAFQAFSRAVFADGALPTATKQLIAVAVAHVTQCPYCIRGRTNAAIKHAPEEIMEAIWVAGGMRVGATCAHALLAVDELEKGAD
jgi:AhpD family alkylhydroperoxidase